MPGLLFATVNNRSAVRCGPRSPRSQACTALVLTQRKLAKTGWLALRLSRICRISAGFILFGGLHFAHAQIAGRPALQSKRVAQRPFQVIVNLYFRPFPARS